VVDEEDKARIREVVGDDNSTSDRMAAAAAAAVAVGRDRLAVGSAGMQGASMDVVVGVGAGAGWSATAHVPWTRHWRTAEAQEASSRD
jgi:hypothetical protein